MVDTVLRKELEEAERIAGQLSAQCTLFDGYYDDGCGIEQASIDPDCFFTSWNMIFEKADELYGKLKRMTRKLYEEQKAGGS